MNLKKLRAYIAMPYSHEDPNVIQARMDLFSKCVAVFTAQDVYAMSPVEKHYTSVKEGTPGDWNFWKGYSEAWLMASQVMIVLTMEGWMKSTGIQGELEICKKRSIPVIFVNPSDILAPGFNVEDLGKFATLSTYTSARM